MYLVAGLCCDIGDQVSFNPNTHGCKCLCHSSPQLNMASSLYLDAFDLNRKLRLRLFRYKTFSGNHFWCNRKSLVNRKCCYGQRKIFDKLVNGKLHPKIEKRLNTSRISAPSLSSLSFLTSLPLLSQIFLSSLLLIFLSPFSSSICFHLFHTKFIPTPC